MAARRTTRAWHDNNILMAGVALVANLAVVLHALDAATGPVLVRGVAGTAAILSAGIWVSIALAAIGWIDLDRMRWRGRGFFALGFAALLMWVMYAAKIVGP